eukprot:4306543-Karenia_brevis.AAC.1
MVAGTGVALTAPGDDLAKPEVAGAQITHTNQKPLGGEGRVTSKMNQGLRVCSAHITSSSEKAIWWLTRVPYDMVFVQEHHQRFKKEFVTTLLAKTYSVIFPLLQKPWLINMERCTPQVDGAILYRTALDIYKPKGLKLRGHNWASLI